MHNLRLSITLPKNCKDSFHPPGLSNHEIEDCYRGARRIARNVACMTKFLVLALAAMAAACAGRDPQPVATVQPTDANATCAMITAEIEANNMKVRELAGEEGAKVAQNVAAGVAGVFIPVLWFGMDFKGAASKEVTALQSRQQYLATLATERCKPQRPR
jgi:hypothetical protein